MNKVELNIFAVRPAGCGCGPGSSCEPTRTIMDDLQDLKNAIKGEGLIEKITSMKFIDIFSPALSKYPEISKKISDGTAEVPIIAFGEEIVSQGTVDVMKITDRLKTV